MILTKELLKRYDACEEGLNFCERNKLYGFDLKRIGEIRGDYGGFVDWLKYAILGVDVDRESIKYEYDANGNIVRKEDYNGNWWVYEYNDNGDKIKEEHYRSISWEPETDGVLVSYRYEYDDKGNMIKREKSNVEGGWMIYEYDSEGKLIRKENSTGFWWEFDYDGIGNQIGKRCSNGRWVKYEYNDRGDMIREEHSGGYMQSYEYDLNDNIIKIYNFSGALLLKRSTELYPNGQLKRINDLRIPLIVLS